MKKIVYFLLFVLCLPAGVMAQSVDDDLYFVPSKNKKEKEEVSTRKVDSEKKVISIYTSPGSTVVVNDRQGISTRDIDEYNRRYEADENDFEMEHDTLYIKRKKNPDLKGEWVTGEFEGTQEDYEYAERIIRFRNPRFAISVNSPIYWDIVYGPGAWDWNVYTDGMYAYAFPTYSNPLWWDWRYSSFSWNWNYGWGWGSPYCSWGYASGYWHGWYHGYWGHHHHHHYYDPYWGWGGGRPYYASRSVINGNNRSYYSGYRGSGSSSRRDYGVSSSRPTHSSIGQSVRRSGTSGGRVVGTRSSSRSNGAVRGGSSYSRRNTETYTRPSSTRSSSTYRSNRTGSYTRGNSSGTTTRRNSNTENYSRRSSGSSYSPRSSSSSYTRSSGSAGGGSYSRGGGSSSRSSGGGSHRR